MAAIDAELETEQRFMSDVDEGFKYKNDLVLLYVFSLIN